MAAVKPHEFTPVDTMRHSAAHLMAAAVMELWPDAKLGVGPVIEHGFYYDIAMEHKLAPVDLVKIEKRMEKIRQRGEAFEREEMPLEAAIAFFRERGQDFKVELLTDLKTRGTTAVGEDEAGDIDAAKPDVASIYRTGAFTDLCRGPHVATTRDIGVVKLKSVAGAYWRGNQENAQLQRVYGFCFPTKEELEAHLHMLEEAEKRDHRKLGQELDLFTFSNLVGPGLPMFTPRGTLLRRELETFVQSLQMPLGYMPVWIPHITKSDLYATSGHLEKFEDDLFYVSSKKTDDRFVMKPMNCPHHTQIYASQPRSYRDLPLRFSEVTSVYRDENTGQLQGLSRVRAITQDDAHVFCRPDQIEQEANAVLDVIERFYEAFGMPLRIRLSVRDPENAGAYLGSDEVWEKAEGALAALLEKRGKQFVKGVGEAAFYGPKIDFIATDAIGREWQLATIQLDFNLPERFDLSFMGDDGVKHRPVMIHRAVLGSVERFLSILIEHFAGAFPAWLAPVQVQVLPVGRDHLGTAERLRTKLAEAGLRAHVDASDDTVGKKIRNGAKMKVPYLIVVGEKEAALTEVNVRVRGKEEEAPFALDDFIARLAANVRERSMELL